MAIIEVIDGYSLSTHAPASTGGPDPSGRPDIVLPTNEGGIRLSDTLLGGHVLLVGGIGQGKTTAMRHVVRGVRQTMRKSDIGIVFDTKGDYFDEFWQPGDIVINDPRASADARPWSLPAELRASSRDSEDREETSNEIASTLFDDYVEHTSQPFFPLAASQLFAESLEDESLLADPPGTLASNASLCGYWKRRRARIADDFQARGSGSYNYIAEPGPQADGILASLTQGLKGVFVGRFRMPVDPRVGDLSVRKTIRERGGKFLFIEYRLRAGKALARLYRLLIDLAIKEALNVPRGHEGRVFFFLDEFRLCPKLQHLDHGLNFGREFGLRFVVGMQSHAQVRAAYGAEADSVLAGFSTVLAFRTANGETRSFIKDTAGTNLKRINLPAIAGNVFQTVVQGHVVEDHDILKLQRGEAIVSLPSSAHGPFRAGIQPYVSKRR